MKLTLAVLLLCGCVAPTLSRPVRPATVGYTVCAEKPDGTVTSFSWVRVDLIGTRDFIPVVNHERSHGSVMRLFGSCNEYFAWVSERSNELRVEAGAFCTAALTAFQQGEPFDSAVSRYAYWLSRGYPQFTLSHDSAVSLIRHGCQLPEER